MNYNPLQNLTWDQLQYIYQEAPVGSVLRSNVASQLSALQLSRQRGIEREAQEQKEV